MTMNATAIKIHCFEAAGLGKAPFRYTGMVYQDMAYGQRKVNIGGVECLTKPGGSCAYCGTYIVNMFNVESADGNRFHVGCECIRKTGDAGLIQKVDRDVKEFERKKRAAKKSAKIAKDREFCQAAQIGLLAQFPHPSSHFAAEGKTLFDWAKWMMDQGNWMSLAATIRAKIAK
jgi:hypothetical protein